MSIAVGKADHFILDRRTVARAYPNYFTAVQRRETHIFSDNLMGRIIGKGDIAGHGGSGDFFSTEGEGLHYFIPGLLLQLAEVDRAAAHPCRGPSFEPPHLKAQSPQRCSKPNRRGLPKPPRGPLIPADKHLSLHKGPGGH